MKFNLKASKPKLLLSLPLFLALAVSLSVSHVEARRLRPSPSPSPTISSTPSPSATPSISSGNPFSLAPFYIDPYSNAKQQADSWRVSRPSDALQMDKIAANPQADWLGDWSGDIYTAVRNRTQTIASTGALPVLVAYNIPLRDCGSYSSGGATSPDSYRTWIRNFTNGMVGSQAVVVLEPDALASMDCLSSTDQQTRLSLLAEAVTILNSHPGTYVYLDAGHAGWQSANNMATRLTSAGVSNARGFSLNTSGTDFTSRELTYGDSISGLIDNKHFIVDTSRNGVGPTADYQWCNPLGRALGERPTSVTADSRADAYFWIKRPGESDGACNGGPAAGSWWADYALGLAQRALY